MTTHRPDDTTIVIPTIGRPSLSTLLLGLAAQKVERLAPVVVVDDRPDAEGPLFEHDFGLDLKILRSFGRGPASARNVGWRHADTPWISFLDDDVEVTKDWYKRLLDDLAAAPSGVAASQGRVTVPPPKGRRPTDAERQTAGLMDARWITADLTVRRSALQYVGGFDERFRRAYREDADLGLRLTGSVGPILLGNRHIIHPPQRGDFWTSVRAQAGNADDMLMRRLHGSDWRHRAAAPTGARSRHLLTTLMALSGVAHWLAGRRRQALGMWAGWLAGTVQFAAERISHGPRTPVEVSTMVVSSVLIPFWATGHTIAGLWRHRSALPWAGPPELVLFDRDGTLIHDVPYNGDPDRVHPVRDAAASIDRLRRASIKVGIVTNQAGISMGLITREQADAVTRRVIDLLGPFAVVCMCPHGSEDECDCRKPAPGMVLEACHALGVPPRRAAVIGDTTADVGAARAAGAVGVLVPNEATSRGERGDIVAPALSDAVNALLAGVAP